MDSPLPQDQEIQKESDLYVYKTDEDDEDEIDRRIRRADERLRRLTITGVPKFNDDFLCEDTLTVEGGYDTGYAVNYVDCGAAAEPSPAPPMTCPDSLIITPSIITYPCCVPDGGTGTWSATSTTINLAQTLTKSSFPPFDCYLSGSLSGADDTCTRQYSDGACSAEYFSVCFPLQWEIFLISGVWYFTAWTLGGTGGPSGSVVVGFFFYAEAASLTSPVVNQLSSCSATLDDLTLDNDYTENYWGAGPQTFTKWGHDGIITF